MILYVIILVLVVALYNTATSCSTKIYWFHKPNCKFCKEMAAEWKKVAAKAKNKYCVKEIDLSLPEYAKMKKNFEIKTVPQIVKVKEDGCRYFYYGDRKSKDILEWVFE